MLIFESDTIAYFSQVLITSIMHLFLETTDKPTLFDRDCSLLMLFIAPLSLDPRPSTSLFSFLSHIPAFHIALLLLYLPGEHLFSIDNLSQLALEGSWNGECLRVRSGSAMLVGDNSRMNEEGRSDNSSLSNKYKRPNKMK